MSFGELLASVHIPIAELRYILRHSDQQPSVFEPESEAVTAFLRALHRAASETLEQAGLGASRGLAGAEAETAARIRQETAIESLAQYV
ncbi:MAG: hypothetical protein AAF560_13960, partial [Acidobacteriota bacterium]